ncbi:UNKNOWN [Stylonychia lemnae]|uniref:Uncharacterized protein n=1 Tax=Stylonychia lemnae TaxID=5949 RepID=A0A078AV40_STYLE|nr:UNKNOWN [Stylonychia lemnae]|eukprot:CDW86265.1 UNKNOWN [Stylonychia lemnae]
MSDENLPSNLKSSTTEQSNSAKLNIQKQSPQKIQEQEKHYQNKMSAHRRILQLQELQTEQEAMIKRQHIERYFQISEELKKLADVKKLYEWPYIIQYFKSKQKLYLQFARVQQSIENEEFSQQYFSTLVRMILQESDQLIKEKNIISQIVICAADLFDLQYKIINNRMDPINFVLGQTKRRQHRRLNTDIFLNNNSKLIVKKDTDTQNSKNTIYSASYNLKNNNQKNTQENSHNYQPQQDEGRFDYNYKESQQISYPPVYFNDKEKVIHIDLSSTDDIFECENQEIQLRQSSIQNRQSFENLKSQKKHNQSQIRSNNANMNQSFDRQYLNQFIQQKENRGSIVTQTQSQQQQSDVRSISSKRSRQQRFSFNSSQILRNSTNKNMNSANKQTESNEKIKANSNQKSYIQPQSQIKDPSKKMLNFNPQSFDNRDIMHINKIDF